MTDEKTKSLLRPHQVAETRSEIQRIERMLQQPHVQDRGAAMQQLQGLRRMLDTQEPKPFAGAEKDTAVRRARELEDLILNGMPTAAEMRRNPSGAVGKHMAWERANKTRILEWKNLQLRLNAGTDDPDVANLERLRPKGGASELDLSVAQIPGKQFYNLGAVGIAVASEEELAVLKSLDPELHRQMALLPNETRKQVLGIVRQFMSPSAAPAPKAKRQRKPLTFEQKEALKARLAAGRAAKKAASVAAPSVPLAA